MRIRPETAAHHTAIRAVNEAAFGTSVEADIVETLRSKSRDLISLIAEIDDAIVGHILFADVSLTGHPHLNIMGLGPMAVVPSHQRHGIGSALVREGLTRCKNLGFHAVVVLGHADYYPRFGFVPAATYGIRSEYDVPEDVFMLVELKAGSLRGVSGVIRYDEAFASASG